MCKNLAMGAEMSEASKAVGLSDWRVRVALAAARAVVVRVVARAVESVEEGCLVVLRHNSPVLQRQNYQQRTDTCLHKELQGKF